LYLFKIPPIFPWFYPTLCWNGERSKNIIYLTFDDGPVPGVTDAILDILASYGINATFFCVGENIQKNPDLFERILQEGHMVGNHTYHHLDGWKHKVDEYIGDILECREIMAKYGFSYDLHFFRPPYGRLKNIVIRKIQTEYRIIMWDVLSYDYSSRLTRDIMLRNTIQHTDGGSIVIFHDSEKTKGTTPFLISQYIDHFIEMNYEFSTINRLFLPN